MQLPGHRVDYRWDANGRPLAVALDGAELACWEFDAAPDAGPRVERIRYAGGVVRETVTDAIDGRALRVDLRRGDETIDAAAYRYDAAARVCDDGCWRYEYDAQGRLAVSCRLSDGLRCEHAYDAAGTLVLPERPVGNTSRAEPAVHPRRPRPACRGAPPRAQRRVLRLRRQGPSRGDAHRDRA